MKMRTLSLTKGAVAGVMLLACAACAQGRTGTDAELVNMQAIAVQFESELHMDGFDLHGHEPKVLIETTPGVSMYSFKDNSVREARYAELSAADREVFEKQAALSGIASSGVEFFTQYFYRFLVTHELGHWASFQVAVARTDAGWLEARAGMRTHVWEQELEANRIAVAYWREHDPAYVERLVTGFRKVLVTWPSPVPAGRGAAEYFNSDYFKEQEPTAKSYSWFQYTLTVQAYDEKPVRTFAQVMNALPKENYGLAVK